MPFGAEYRPWDSPDEQPSSYDDVFAGIPNYPTPPPERRMSVFETMGMYRPNSVLGGIGAVMLARRKQAAEQYKQQVAAWQAQVELARLKSQEHQRADPNYDLVQLQMPDGSVRLVQRDRTGRVPFQVPEGAKLYEKGDQSLSELELWRQQHKDAPIEAYWKARPRGGNDSEFTAWQKKHPDADPLEFERRKAEIDARYRKPERTRWQMLERDVNGEVRTFKYDPKTDDVIPVNAPGKPHKTGVEKPDPDQEILRKFEANQIEDAMNDENAFRGGNSKGEVTADEQVLIDRALSRLRLQQARRKGKVPGQQRKYDPFNTKQ